MALSHDTVICVLRQLNINNCNLIEDCEPENIIAKKMNSLNKTKENITLSHQESGFMMTPLRTINVVAAIIIEDGKVFATQRGYGEWQGWWEFPGGKIEAGESPAEALEREIREELDSEIAVGTLLETVEWDYPAFHLSMQCFICRLKSDSIQLKEHKASAWLSKDQVGSVRWLPADLILLEKIAEHIE